MNTEDLLTNGLIPLTVLVISWIMPSLTQTTLPFGARIPPGRADAPVIAVQRKRYRWQVGVIGPVVIAAGLAVPAATHVTLAGVTTLLTVVVCLTAYARARKEIIAVKERERWYEGLRQGVVADTSLRTAPERYPWPWAVPSVLIVLGTAALGIARYPSMPHRLALHVNGSGHTDAFATRSVGTAFLPVFAQFAATALIVVLTWFSFRSRPDLDPARPGDSARRHRRFSVQVVTGALVLAAFVDLSVLAAAWQMWHRAGHFSALLVNLPIVIGLVAVVVISIRTGQAGSRLPATGQDTAEDTGMVHTDDDRYWHAGMLYANRTDPSVFVQKRFGIGWTMNFGNPRAVLLLAALLAVAVLAPVLVR
jgi:uncharacterized membrane protein